MDVDNRGPFNLIVKVWESLLTQAQALKDRRFRPEAEEGLRFFCGPYDFLFQGFRTDKFFKPGYNAEDDIIVTVNKVAEVVQIFGPTMYQRNPNRRANTRPTEELVRDLDPNLFALDPQTLSGFQKAMQAGAIQQSYDQSIGAIFEGIENTTPDLLDLKDHSRRAIDEALITGLGLTWTEPQINPATGMMMCGNFYGSSRDLLIDPSVGSIRDIKWCARRTIMHRWEAERKYRLPPNTLPATRLSSSGLSANSDPNLQDQIEVWEVWSKVGIGGRMKEAQAASTESKVAYELFGDFCYLVLVPGHPYPLNLPPWLFADPDPWPKALVACQWPTPYWLLRNGWPFTPYYFHTIPNDPWPMSHLTPGMGELKFLNWFYSKIVQKIGITCRDFVIIDDSVSDDWEKQIKYGRDLTVLKAQGLSDKKIQEIIQFLQHPTWNPEIWKVAGEISQAFDDRVGLSELLYGESSKQMRSAEESARRYDSVNVRPGDMASRMDDAMSEAANKEMLCNHWHMRPQDVEALLGPVGGFAWSTLVYGQDPSRILNIQMRIETDSTKKPNRSTLVDNLTTAMQQLLPVLQPFAMGGLTDPMNYLISTWADAVGIKDPERFTITMPMPLAPPEAGAGQTTQSKAA